MCKKGCSGGVMVPMREQALAVSVPSPEGTEIRIGFRTPTLLKYPDHDQYYQSGAPGTVKQNVYRKLLENGVQLWVIS